MSFSVSRRITDNEHGGMVWYGGQPEIGARVLAGLSVRKLVWERTIEVLMRGLELASLPVDD